MSTQIFTVVLISLSLLSCDQWHGCDAQVTNNGCFSSIYSFGDSSTDTGNLVISDPSNLISKLPYGQTHFKRATGRSSDGRLMLDFLADSYGMRRVDPVNSNASSFTSGANFAVAGATSMPPSFFSTKDIKIGTCDSLQTQIQWFLDYRKKFCDDHNGDCNDHFAKALFVMGSIGVKDYEYAFMQNKSVEEVQGYVASVVANITDSIATLIIRGGARKVMIQNIYPLGCTPSYLTAFPSELRDRIGCIPKFNEFVKGSNDVLIRDINTLRQQFPDVTIIYADYYSAVLTILQNPKPFGIQQENVFIPCCGSGGPYNYSASTPCGSEGIIVCHNPKKRLSWDGINLTEITNKQVSDLFVYGQYTSPTLNSTCPANPLLNVNPTFLSVARPVAPVPS